MKTIKTRQMSFGFDFFCYFCNLIIGIWVDAAIVWK